MFFSAQDNLPGTRLPLPNGGKGDGSVFRSRAPAAADEGPPLQRLTAQQIRSVSARCRAKGRAGDETALRVADALDWVAARRATQEPKHFKALAGRISAWMGLADPARSN